LLSWRRRKESGGFPRQDPACFFGFFFSGYLFVWIGFSFHMGFFFVQFFLFAPALDSSGEVLCDGRGHFCDLLPSSATLPFRSTHTLTTTISFHPTYFPTDQPLPPRNTTQQPHPFSFFILLLHVEEEQQGVVRGHPFQQCAAFWRLACRPFVVLRLGLNFPVREPGGVHASATCFVRRKTTPHTDQTNQGALFGMVIVLCRSFWFPLFFGS
jgi:hypothetical protein